MILTKGTYQFSAALVMLFSVSLYAECLMALPDSVPEIDGDVAGQEEVVAAHQAVEAYVKQGESYLKCLEKAKSAGELNTYKYKVMNNEALDRLELVSARFNRELRKFKRRKHDEMESAE